MKLSDWLSEHDIRPETFAGQIERNPSTVSRILNGITMPSPDTIQRIRVVTKGEVQPNDFFTEAAV